MKKRFLFVAVTILAVTLAFTGCDLFEPPVGGGSTETVEPRTIKGTDSKGQPVEIKFVRPSRKVIDPENNDNYEINYKGNKVSEGYIKVSGTSPKTITFYPKGGSDNDKFEGTYNGGDNLTFPNNKIPLKDGEIDFRPGSNTINSDAQKVADKFGENASVDGNNVVIDFSIDVTHENIDIPAGVGLVFNTRGSYLFIDSNITITAKGGIEVRNGRDVRIVGGGKLAVEGSSAIRGTLIVGGEATGDNNRKGTLELGAGTFTIGENGHLDIRNGTLDISGNVTIGNKGKLSLLGDRAAAIVYKKYDTTDTTDTDNNPNLRDSVLTGSGSLVVENGGKFIIPDPLAFDTTKAKMEIEVKAGGEMFIFTGAYPLAKGSDNKVISKHRLHPLIGIASTEAGASTGADYVMNPGANPDSKIKITIISKIPDLVLTGRATVLGPLDPNDENWRTRRSSVYLTYRFTVDENSVLQVGNSEERYSSFLVCKIDDTGYGSGKLTNNGRILISKKSGMLATAGTSITPSTSKVYKLLYGDSTNPTPIKDRSKSYSIIPGSQEESVKIWDDDEIRWGLIPDLQEPET